MLSHANGDQNPSLSLKQLSDRSLINCHKGCKTKDILAAVGLEMSDLFYEPREHGNAAKRSPTANNQAARNSTSKARAGESGSARESRESMPVYDPNGLTLEKFSEAKQLPVEFLTKQGVRKEVNIDGEPHLVFEYCLANDDLAPRHRIRLSMGKKVPDDPEGRSYEKFRWSGNKSDGEIVPCGLWLLPEPEKRADKDLWLVEGESDALTLWHYGYAALGIPGNSNMKCLAADHVEGLQRAIVVIEDDDGGDAFYSAAVKQLHSLRFKGLVRICNM
jgi:hypothetical protein